MTFKLGLTGSIGMGKSTAARFFAQNGIPVWDADAAVHRLYGKDGAAVDKIAANWPEAVKDGAVDRATLGHLIRRDEAILGQIEKIVFPLLADDRQGFINNTATDIILFDIPLLYETGAQTWLDAVAVVSAPAEVQRERVLARPGMSDEQYELILSRQMPDAEKRARADWIIPSIHMAEAEQAVLDIIREIREGLD